MKKKYHLKILVGGGFSESEIVEADDVDVYGGSYSFRNKAGSHFEVIARYPVDRTIIEKIEKV